MRCAARGPLACFEGGYRRAGVELGGVGFGKFNFKLTRASRDTPAWTRGPRRSGASTPVPCPARSRSGRAVAKSWTPARGIAQRRSTGRGRPSPKTATPSGTSRDTPSPRAQNRRPPRRAARRSRGTTTGPSARSRSTWTASSSGPALSTAHQRAPRDVQVQEAGLLARKTLERQVLSKS